MKIKISVKTILFFLIYFTLSIIICYSNSAEKVKGDVFYLYKVGEIKEKFSNEENNYFWRISDICCDDKNNLYVADSGWNRISKFDSEGKYIGSFGRDGQGPGEFLARPGSNPLRISFGNDKNIYVTDTGNLRLSIFSQEGKFLKQFTLPRFLYDSAQVNSKGEIYLISKNGTYTIDFYDKNFKLIRSFLAHELFYQYRFYKEPNEFSEFINDMILKKIITKNDHLIVLSNISMTIFNFNDNQNLVKKFVIRNEKFEKDFKKGLKKAISRGRFSIPFHEFILDNNEHLFLFYFSRALNNDVIYRYKKDGSFIDVLQLPDDTKGIYCIDGIGTIYAVTHENRILIYRIKNKEKSNEMKIRGIIHPKNSGFAG